MGHQNKLIQEILSACLSKVIQVKPITGKETSKSQVKAKLMVEIEAAKIPARKEKASKVTQRTNLSTTSACKI